MKKIVFAILAIAFLAAGCSLQSGGKVVKQDNVQKQQPVSGLDANGCKISEGYVHSKVRNECLKLSEKGIELPPNADNPEQRSAYVVLAIDDETGGWKATSSNAEVFLPGATSSLVMTSKEAINTGWTKVNGNARLLFWKGIYYFSNSVDNKPLYQGSQSQQPVIQISEAEARTIAEKVCIKRGETIGSAAGSYNDNSKTWWFEAKLSNTPKGCNPACVVSVETKTAEINWRCTGLLK